MPRELWDASTTADIVIVPERTVLSLSGQGAPEGEAFQQSVAAIYGVAYTLKFSRKKAGRPDFKIGPLEGRWWADGVGVLLPQAPRESWRWELRLAVPTTVTAAELARTIDEARQKKGGKLGQNPQAPRVVVTTLQAAKFCRVLHVGPYATEGQSFERIGAMVSEAGLKVRYEHLEVYLGDPRRTKPEKLKTVLLQELL